MIFFSVILSLRLKSFFVGFFLICVYSFQILRPNKFYAQQVLSAFDLGNNPKYPVGKIINYGINANTIMIFLSLLFMAKDYIQKYYSNRLVSFRKSLLKNKYSLMTAIFTLTFLFYGYAIAYNYSPFPELSAVSSTYYSLTFIVALLLYHYFKEYRNKFRIIYVVLSFTIFMQFFISTTQLIKNSNIGLPIEAGRVVNAPGEVEESRLFGPRVSGTFYLHNQLALAALTSLILLLPKLKKTKSKNFLITILAAVVTIVLTQSRSNWIALIFSAILFTRFYYPELKKNLTNLLSYKSIVYLTLVFTSLTFIIIPRLILSLDTFHAGGGFDFRKSFLKEAVEVFLTNPWLGFGAQTNEYILFSFFPRGITYTFPFPVHQGHLQFLLEFGIIGLILFSFPFYLVFRTIVVKSISNFNYLKINKDYISRFVLGVFAYNMYYLFLSHGVITEFQYLGLILGFGLIAIN